MTEGANPATPLCGRAGIGGRRFAKFDKSGRGAARFGILADPLGKTG